MFVNSIGALVEPCLVRSCADTQHSLPFVFLLFEAKDYGQEGWERSRHTYIVSALILEYVYAISRLHKQSKQVLSSYVPSRRSRPTFVINGSRRIVGRCSACPGRGQASR